jgi:ADP-heptose:LPS heptosyltransferase
VRKGYEQLASLFPTRLIWKTTQINPYKETPDVAAIKLLLDELGQESYDLLLTTTYNRTWSDELIAALLISSHRVALGDAHDDHEILTKILPELGAVMPQHLYDQYIPVEEKIHETEKYQLFWNKITSEKKNIPGPQLVIPEIESTRAEDVLTRAGLKKGEFIFCFPAGVSNVSLKTWPEKNFAQVIACLEKTYSLKTFVIAHESEKNIVDKVVQLANVQGAAPAVWLGRDGDIPLVSALLAKSYFYLGNDTGMMHIAAALDKPVVAIFGGGTWPRFLPAASWGIVFTQELPCSYCMWNDCWLADAPCIKMVSVNDVIESIERLLKGIVNRVEIHLGLSLEKLRPYYNKAMEMRRDRDNAVAEIHKRDAQIASLNQAVSERNSQIASLKQDVAGLYMQITNLNQQLNTITTQLDRIFASKSWILTKPFRFIRRSLSTQIYRPIYSKLCYCTKLIWRHLPLTSFNKQRLKNTLFQNLPIVFGRTNAYRNWQKQNPNSGIPSNQSS